MPLETSPQIALRAKYVFPVEGPPIEGGVVTLSGERIVAVGKSSDAAAVHDLGNVAILPGLVNAHSHLEFSSLQRPLGEPGMALPDWIRQVIAYRGRGDLDIPSAIARGLAECSASGTTVLAEIATAPIETYAVEAYATGADQPHVGSIDLMLLHEVIGFSEPRSQSAFDAVMDRLNSFDTQSDVQPGISPHAPYTVHPKLLDRIVAYSAEHRTLLAMHVAESQEELQLLRDGDGALRDLLEERSMWDATAIARGSRPLDYLRRLAKADHALVVHGNYLDAEELQFLGNHRERLSLVYCPRTHEFFDHTTYPLQQALSLGVRVVLGTDSRASNPDVILWEEMRYVAKHHAGVSAERILRMGTLDGARGLRCDDRAGSLICGKSADLAIVALAEQRMSDPHKALSELLLDEASQVVQTWHRGRAVWPKRGNGE